MTFHGKTTLGDSPWSLVSFYGVTPVAQATAIAAPNTQTGAYVQADVQSIVTAVNAIRVALQTIGITA